MVRRGPLSMAKVFLSGGTGLIGGALMTALLERGDQVVALARSDASASASLSAALKSVAANFKTNRRSRRRWTVVRSPSTSPA